MTIVVRAPKVDLSLVDELIELRIIQQEGKVGAPKKLLGSGIRVGAALNQSAIVLISALLQSYVEDVFVYKAMRKFHSLRDENNNEKFRNSIKRWGNPNSQNISRLFISLGIVDPFINLSWQRTSSATIKLKLDSLNKLRNDIAHGKPPNTGVSLKSVKNYRAFTEQFAARFANHIRTMKSV